jgi:hypothetical protein
MAYDLVLLCWAIRNHLEYNEGDEESETISKRKLIGNFLWNIDRIGDKIENPYSQLLGRHFK